MTQLPRRSRAARWREALLVRIFQPFVAGVQRTRNDQFAVLGPVPNSVVFLGDSITEGGEWSEWLPEIAVTNRGVGGETTRDILKRLDTAIEDSRAVFLLAGTNDLGRGDGPDDIANRLQEIVGGISLRAPNARIYLQSVMPRTASYAHEISALNLRLQAFAEVTNHVTYVDLWPALSTDQARLRPEYSFDSLHLNGAGYRAWRAVIRPYISQLDFQAPAGAAE